MEWLRARESDKLCPMIRHILLLQQRPGATSQDIDACRVALTELVGPIAGLVNCHWGENIAPAERRAGFTHGFTMDFVDRESLDAYGPHPQHQLAVAKIRATSCSTSCCDRGTAGCAECPGSPEGHAGVPRTQLRGLVGRSLWDRSVSGRAHRRRARIPSAACRSPGRARGVARRAPSCDRPGRLRGGPPRRRSPRAACRRCSAS